MMDKISYKLVYGAESGADVEDILKTYGYWDEENYSPIGGYSNNLTTINVQGRTAEAALGERIINSVDALLLRKCLEIDEVNPRSPKAPKSLKEAVEKYYKIPNGRLHEIDSRTKKRQDKIRDLAETFLSVTGYEAGLPTISLLDLGEGQSPHKFNSTLLSLSNKDSPYKEKIRFVQGRFNQGGSGSLKFSDYTLILSKRAPFLLESKYLDILNEGKKPGDYGFEERQRNDDEWGWTIVRRFSRKDNYDVYKYLAPNGEIMSFSEDKLRLAPQKRIPIGQEAALSATPYDVEIESGTLIKMFNYKLGDIYEQDAWTTLRRVMDTRVFYRIPLPIRIYELRKHRIKGKGDASNLCGMLYTLKDNPQVLFQSDPIVAIDDHIDGIGDVYMECWILNWKNKAAKSDHYIGKMSIGYLVNGQVHYAFKSSELAGKEIRKHNLPGYFFAAVDLTQVPVTIRQNILPPDRQSVDDSDEHRLLKKVIFEKIRTNPIFEEVDNAIYESKMGDYSKSEIKISDDLFKQMAKTHPRFIEFMKGQKISVTKSGTRTARKKIKKWKGRQVPTQYTYVED